MSEEDIHRAVVRHLAVRAAPGVVYWHTPNGDLRKPGVAGRLKALGTRPGVPDLLLLRGGTLYGLELKRETGGRLSPNQRVTLSQLTAAGALVATCCGLDSALAALEGWGLLRPSRGVGF